MGVDPDKIRLTVAVDPEVYREIANRAWSEKRPMGAIVERAIAVEPRDIVELPPFPHRFDRHPDADGGDAAAVPPAASRLPHDAVRERVLANALARLARRRRGGA